MSRVAEWELGVELKKRKTTIHNDQISAAKLASALGVIKSNGNHQAVWKSKGT